MFDRPFELLPLPSPESYEKWMSVALEEAERAAAADEVPVGAVVVRGDQVLSRCHERKIALSDPTAHAEILALREAARHYGDWRLEDCVLFVTLEPCPMCAGAILLARIPLVVYGAPNYKFGAVRTHLRLFEMDKWNHHVEVVEGVLAAKCGELLTRFFAQRRQQPC
ncbi:MAG: tRNA adenosine(34) deaminase TadA [Candidatus Sumerlaeaceae bacterium]|nr:tRNA adenosine(34) deaminase TadA [Candidatus Sumerlaeaceae bacterium]